MKQVVVVMAGSDPVVFTRVIRIIYNNVALQILYLNEEMEILSRSIPLEKIEHFDAA